MLNDSNWSNNPLRNLRLILLSLRLNVNDIIDSKVKGRMARIDKIVRKYLFVVSNKTSQRTVKNIIAPHQPRQPRNISRRFLKSQKMNACIIRGV